MIRFGWVWLIGLLATGLPMVQVIYAAEKPAFDDASLEFFEKQVRPILVARCFECHSETNGSIKGGLRLDRRDGILKGGDTGPAVDLDKPETSLFLSAINYGDIYQMPPKSKLPASEIAILTQWVEKGLPFPATSGSAASSIKPFNLEARAAEHWCWQPVQSSSIPDVKNLNWPVTNADRFILSKLEAKGIIPAEPADKSTLLRRVYFDLIGLPPSPEEVVEFLQDEDPKALERVVDRLLASVHFGERWCRHWLDLTRYGETRGHEFDPAIPNAWQYRDYVTRAINDDVPYNRFLIEHLAGDLVEPRWRTGAGQQSPLPLPLNEAPLGTGFWFLGEEVHSPVDIRKDETDRMDNRLDVLSKTFLGLTVSCARCHDHKFDPISQRDYYALAGFAISGCYRQIRVETFEQHRQIAEQLQVARSRARSDLVKSIVESSQPIVDKLDRYLIGAKRVIDETADTPKSDNTATAAELLNRSIDRVAAEKSLDRELLNHWRAELLAASQSPSHPLHELWKTDAAAQDLASVEKNAESVTGIVIDFGDPSESFPVIQDGVCFGLRPVVRGQLVLDSKPDTAGLHIATVGGWQRDLFWKNITLAPGTEVDTGTLGSFQSYGRMVRSQEFILTAHNLWYLVRGSVNVYSSVNSHVLINGPLHGSLLQHYKQTDDQWHWVRHPMDQYQGHRMHIEFSPADQGPCSIAMIVQSDVAPKLPGTIGPFGLAPAGTVEQRITAFQQAVRSAMSLIVERNSEDPTLRHSATGNSASQSPNNHAHIPQSLSLADWIVTHPTLFAGNAWQLNHSALQTTEAELAKLVQWESTLAPAMLESNGIDEFFLVRGNSNTPKDQVNRRFLEVFQNTDRHVTANGTNSPARKPASLFTPETEQNNQHNASTAEKNSCTPSGRLELAHAILRSPLASRVAVNRIWHHLFGRGIVPTVDNMGILGQPPSHPELLDYLATEFVQGGWSTKAMIRSLVLSRTYQMQSRPTDADLLDPNNELWHRMPIKRLEGEVIRDSLLAISGRLDRKTFGPSIPIHLTPFMEGRGRPGVSGPLDGAGRRSIYIAVRRNFLSPMMLAFDTPSPFSTVGRRTSSNVPSQALILMNDPFVVQQAKVWSESLLADPGVSIDERLDRMFLMAFGRHPTGSEMTEARSFLDAQIQNQPDKQPDAWANLCHVMFNVKEFVFID